MNDSDSLVPLQQLRTVQIIAAALLLGLLSLCGVAVGLVHLGNNGRGVVLPQQIPFVTWIAIALFAVETPLSFLVPKIITRNALKAIVEGKPMRVQQWTSSEPPPVVVQLATVYQTAMIVGLALLEGVGFLAGVAYLLEAEPVSLGIAAVVVVLMIARFPLANRVFDWIQRQVEEIESLRESRRP